MIRRIFVSLVGAALVLLSTAAAQDPNPDDPEPPVRLKKKERPARPDDKEKPKTKEADPKAEPKEPPKDDPMPEGPDPGAEEKEVLDRIAKNLREAEERLAKKDTSDATRQVQRDVVKDLDALIEATKRAQSQQQNQNQNQQPQAGSPSGGRSSRNQQQQQAGGSRSKQRRESTARSGNRPDKGTQANQRNQTGQGNEAGAGKAGSEAGPSKMADLYKDVWGHLPESLRMEMDAYARERFMPRYSELLKQYYSTIAEKGRRKETDR